MDQLGSTGFSGSVIVYKDIAPPNVTGCIGGNKPVISITTDSADDAWLAGITMNWNLPFDLPTSTPNFGLKNYSVRPVFSSDYFTFDASVDSPVLPYLFRPTGTSSITRGQVYPFSFSFGASDGHNQTSASVSPSFSFSIPQIAQMGDVEIAPSINFNSIKSYSCSVTDSIQLPNPSLNKYLLEQANSLGYVVEWSNTAGTILGRSPDNGFYNLTSSPGSLSFPININHAHQLLKFRIGTHSALEASAPPPAQPGIILYSVYSAGVPVPNYIPQYNIDIKQTDISLGTFNSTDGLPLPSIVWLVSGNSYTFSMRNGTGQEIIEGYDPEGDAISYRLVLVPKYGDQASYFPSQTDWCAASSSINLSSAIIGTLNGEYRAYFELKEVWGTGNDQNATSRSLKEFTLMFDNLAPAVGTISIGLQDNFYPLEAVNHNEVWVWWNGVLDESAGVSSIQIWEGAEEPEPNSFTLLSVNSFSSALLNPTQGSIDISLSGTSVKTLFSGRVQFWLSAVQPGEYASKTITVRVNDSAGNSTVRTQTVLFDRKAPAAPFIRPYTYNDQRRPVIEWVPSNEQSSGDSVHHYEISCIDPESNESRELPILPNNMAAIIVDAPENTAIEVTVTAVDLAGNRTAASKTVYTYVELGEILTANAGYEFAEDQTTINLYHAFTVAGADYQVIELKILGVWTALGDIAGNTDPLRNEHLDAHEQLTYHLVSRTSDGNLCATGAEFDFPADSSADLPPLPATNLLPANGAYACSTTVLTWSPSFDADLDALQYEVFLKADGQSEYLKLSTGTACSVTLPVDLQDGVQYSWYVETISQPVNMAEVRVQTAPQYFTMDLQPPVVVLIDKLGLYSNATGLSLGITDNNGLGSMQAYAVNRATQTCTDLTIVPQGPGAGYSVNVGALVDQECYELHVEAVDVAGNKGSWSLPSLGLDYTVPSIRGLTFKQDNFASNLVPVELALFDDYSGIHSIQYAWTTDPAVLPSGAWSSTTVRSVPNLSEQPFPPNTSVLCNVVVLFSGDPGQNYYLAAKLVDWAGNISAVYVAEADIAIDLTPPTTSLAVAGFGNASGRLYITEFDQLIVDYVAEDLESDLTIRYALESEGQPLEWHASWAEAQSALVPIDGMCYRIAIQATNDAGLSTLDYSPWLLFDASAPEGLMYTVQSSLGAALAGEQIRLTLSALDVDSGILELQVALGSSLGETDISQLLTSAEGGWLRKPAADGKAEFNITLPASYTGICYVSCRALNGVGLVAQRQEASLSFAIVKPDGVLVWDEGPYSADAERLAARWSYAGTGSVLGYRYRIIDTNKVVVRDWTNTPATNATATGLSLLQAETYFFEVQAELAEGSYSSVATSLGVTIDQTAPVLHEVLAPRYLTTANAAFSWQTQDPESGIGRVEVLTQRARDDGSFEVVGDGWQDLVPVALGVAIPFSLLDTEGVSLITSGDRLYFSLRFTNAAGLAVESRLPVTVFDTTPPPAPQVQDQGGAINTAQASEDGLSASWVWSAEDPECPIVRYEYATSLNTTDFSLADWHDVGLVKSISEISVVSPDGQIVFIAIRATNAAGLSAIGISNGIVCDSTAPFLSLVRLSNTAAGPDANYLVSDEDLKLYIEAYETVSEIDGYEARIGRLDENLEWYVPLDLSGLAWNSPNEAIIDLGTEPLPADSIIIFKGIVHNNAGLDSHGFTSGVVLDTYAPTITRLSGFASPEGLFFDWEATSSFSPIQGYEVALIPSGSELATADFSSVGLATTYYQPAADLVEGSYQLVVRALGANGLWSDTKVSLSIVYDLSPPVLQNFNYPAYVSNSLRIKIDASDDLSNIAEFQYAIGSVDNSSLYTQGWVSVIQSHGALDTTVPFTVLAVAITDGSQLYIRVRAKNSNGLWSNALVSSSILVDKTIPTTPIVACDSYARSVTLISGSSLHIEDGESGINLYRYGLVQVGQTEPSTWISKPLTGFIPVVSLSNHDFDSLDLMEGMSYRLAVQARNGAMEWSQPGYSNPFMVDTIAPAIDFPHPESTIVVNDGHKAIAWSVSEDAIVTLCLIQPDGTRIFYPALEADGQLLYEYTFNETQVGVYYLTATLVDQAGNSGNGGTSERRQRIRFNAAPIVDIDSLIYTTPGRPLNLREYLRVLDPDAAEYPDLSLEDQLQWAWDFGDASPISYMALPDHRYYHLDVWQPITSYELVITVTDHDGKVTNARTVVQVRNTRVGSLFVDEYWQGSHEILGDIVVPNGLRLTIANGTLVSVGGNYVSLWDHELRIEGTLEAAGALFMERDPGKYWSGIVLVGVGNLQNCVIRNATRAVTLMPGCSAQLGNAEFRDNLIGLHCLNPGQVITNCRFIGNAEYAIKEEVNADPTVQGCYFLGNIYAYYDTAQTVLDVAQINSLPGNFGNTGE